jgi:hypothetical protein
VKIRPRKLVQGVSLAVLKKRERPEFAPPPKDPSQYGYVITSRSMRTKGWSRYLCREGFRWSRGTLRWVYDQHDDGSFISIEEAEWVANRLRDIVCGDISLSVGQGFFVEPIPDLPPVHRPYLRPRHP